MRLFVGGFPRTATKEDIEKLFKQFGAAEEDIVLPRDRRTRRRKGFAYVEIADPERARAAIAVFEGFIVEGKPLTVCAAEDRPPKRGRHRGFAAIGFLTAAMLCGSIAQADVAATDVALTLNPLFGSHQSFNDRTTPPPVPVPLLEVRHRFGPFEIVAAGLPPIASAKSDDPIQGRTSTRLTIFDGTFRVWDPLRRFSVGIGETLYNQGTHYVDPVEIAGTGETQYSRIAGAHYEIGYHSPYHHGSVEATLSYAPTMLGTQFTIYDVGTHLRRADPEHADQVDGAVRWVHAVNAHNDILLGVRYINYTARYAEINSTLADRNCGILPVFGFRTRLR